jgi:hypothetical protein
MTPELLTKEETFDTNYRIVKRHLDVMLRVAVKHPNTELYFGLEDAIKNLKHEADYVQEMMKHD